MKVLLVGPYPPPYGGIATTVRDLHAYLSERDGCEVVVLNIGEGRRIPSDRYRHTTGYGDYILKVLGYALRGYAIHLETNGHNLKSWLSAFVCAVAGLLNLRKTVIAFGSGNLPAYVRHIRGWRRLVARAVCAWAGILICRNTEMQDAVLGIGADPSRIKLVPGFLGLGASKPAAVSHRIESFLNRHEPLLGAVAGPGPEYGLPLLTAAVERLQARYPRVGLVIMGPGPEARGQIDGYDRIKKRVLLAGPLPHEEVLGVMGRLTLFVRPSYFDGDSNSVREALILGVPVVASDTAYRPAEVVTFATGNLDEFVRALEEALDHPEESRARARDYSQGNGFEQIIQLYHSLNGKQPSGSEDANEGRGGGKAVARTLPA